VLRSNRVGTDPSGLEALPNFDGVAVIAASGNVLADNLVSGNTQYGVLFASGADGNRAENNRIGTDDAGSGAIGNGKAGLAVVDSSDAVVLGNIIVASGAGRDEMAYNVAFVTTDAESGDRTENIVFRGNHVGAPVVEGTPAPTFGGILVDGAANSSIGAAGQGNVIAGHAGAGITVRGVTATGITIAGNQIGVRSVGLLGYAPALAPGSLTANGNGGPGILLEAGYNTIGGTEPGEGNVIAGNGGEGVYVAREDVHGNSIRGNSIYANGGAGIELFPGGVEWNDDQDADAGANDLQNYPELSRAEQSGVQLTVEGFLRSTPR
jgi:parallel beta-helix repeat protein